LKAIGSFSAERNIKYSAAISQFMKEQIGVEPEHCVIQFMNMEPENVSICGTTLKAIGSFSAERNIKYSAAISQFMKEQIGVEPEHCVIQFMNMEPENVSICGTTVKVLNEKGNK
uniref:Alba domain-containing protein n=1 Tax=Gongylonema pulchrum TaxID=637853 RepID=A0A183EZA6_9BILA